MTPGERLLTVIGSGLSDDNLLRVAECAERLLRGQHYTEEPQVAKGSAEARTEWD